MAIGNLRALRIVPYLTLAWISAVVCSEPGLQAQPLSVVDRGIEAGFQQPLGLNQRGRALVVADFDLDGRPDAFIGTPRDRSMVLRNVTPPGSPVVFEVAQVLLDGDLAWGAVSADFDNDGDYDLFVPIGGNENVGLDVYFRNLWLETGVLQFENATAVAGVAGPVPPGAAGPLAVASANAVAGDVDRDGDVDLFVSVNTVIASAPELLGRNLLWLNDGTGRFTDVTDSVGLGATALPSRHSTLFDIDNDGDLDLYENNFRVPNVLWRSLLVETGQLGFEDATASFSDLPTEDVSFPSRSFASCSADLDNDGWEDLLVFTRGSGSGTGGPYPVGHALFMNQGGTKLRNTATASGLNSPFQGSLGVMGCQVGDLDLDGTSDIFIGNGGPPGGQYNQLFLGGAEPDASPQFAEASALIDFPAAEPPGTPPGSFPSYPYRTHGTVMTDFDGDGLPELAVVNGGPAGLPDAVREPNRFFQVSQDPRPHFFKVRAVGDGWRVSRDAVGTRFALTVSRSGGPPWTLRRTLFAGSCFSAQSGFEILFGLADADAIHELRVLWPDGAETLVSEGLAIDGSLVVSRAQPIFLDGFEAGDVGAWSAAVP